jgi:hypothetical protein
MDADFHDRVVVKLKTRNVIVAVSRLTIPFGKEVKSQLRERLVFLEVVFCDESRGNKTRSKNA